MKYTAKVMEKEVMIASTSEWKEAIVILTWGENGHEEQNDLDVSKEPQDKTREAGGGRLEVQPHEYHQTSTDQL